MIPVNALDAERFAQLYNAGPSFSDCPSPSPPSGRSAGDATVPGHDQIGSVEELRPEDADCGLSKRVPACLDGEFPHPHPRVDEPHTTFAKKQR